MKVELIPLAVVDLSFRYARHMGDKKIRHYKVSAISALMGELVKPLDQVAEFIRKTEPDAEISVRETRRYMKNDPDGSDSSMIIDDVTDKVCTRKLRKQLLRKKVNGQIFQYEEPMSPADARRFNSTPIVNKWGVETDELPPTYKLSIGDWLAYAAFKVGLGKLVPPKHKVRKVTACTYLSYRYDEGQEKEAYGVLYQDLKILSDRGLIQGHLTMPSTLSLADTVGSLRMPKVIFCFLFVDTNKLAEQLGKSLLDLPRNPTSLIGVKGETLEGGIGPSISEMVDYEIEEVEVSSETPNKSRQAYLDNYVETRDAVNEVAKRANALREEVNVETEAFTQDRQVHVNMKITKK